MDAVKILALDEEDLTIVSAHLQDGIVQLGDINYSAKNRQFVLVANRFDWAEPGKKDSGFRRRTGLCFSQVDKVRSQKIKQGVSDAVLSLLAIDVKPGKIAPQARIDLVFSGGGLIELDVECIEVEMEDLGPRWGTANVPQHDNDE